MKQLHFSLAAAATALLAAVPAFAQADALPERPIARQEVIATVKRLFAAMDTNHDGAVSHGEFEAYRARMAGRTGGSPFEHVGGHWFERSDANGDGRVTLTEAGARPLQLFDMADTDHDGTISLAERRVAMMMMALGGK